MEAMTKEEFEYELLDRLAVISANMEALKEAVCQLSQKLKTS